MTVNLQTEHQLEFLSLKGGCTGSSESTLKSCQNATLLEISCHGSFLLIPVRNIINDKMTFISLSSGFATPVCSATECIVYFACSKII